MINPLQYAVYKGMGGNNGAVQFNFQNPHFYKAGTRIKDFTGEEAFEVVDGRRRLRDEWKERQGAIFMEIAGVKGKNVYDWDPDSKIIIALSIDDMGKILHALVTGEECKLMHDPGAKSQTAGAVKKYLNVTSPGGTTKGCFLTATQIVGTDKRTHRVPLTGAELLILRSLLVTAIPKALNW